MKFGSVCSGIEAASVAWEPLGWTAAWFAEIEPFPSAVLAHHYPSVPNLGDMTTIARRVLTGEVEAPDVLCGGTPCQSFSVAGLRESLADERGNLTLKFVELADAIDHVRVRAGKPAIIVFWENVPGVLSTKDNAFGCFLAGIAGEDGPLEPPEARPAAGKSSRYWKWNRKLNQHTASWANAGCVYGPRRAVAWRTLDAQYFGVAQRRRRVFVVASARNDFDPAAVLFEWDGLRRDIAPSRKTGKAAPTIPNRSTAGGGLGTDFDCDGGLISVTIQAGKKSAGSATQQDAHAGLLIPVAFGGNNQSGPIDVATARNACASASASGRMDFETETFLVQPTHTLRGEGFDASEDGAGRGAPLVPVAGAICRDSFAGGMGGRPEGAAVGHVVPVAFPANLSGTQCASTENLAPSMGAKNPTAIAVSLRGREGGDKPHVLAAMMVRRLTPEECEALQGFPRSYTAIPWRGKPADQCPDGPRYKALGNSWAVPVARWIGRRIAQTEGFA